MEGRKTAWKGQRNEKKKERKEKRKEGREERKGRVTKGRNENMVSKSQMTSSVRISMNALDHKRSMNRNSIFLKGGWAEGEGERES